MVLPSVKRVSIAKVSILLAVLVSLPRNIHMYSIFNEGGGESVGLWLTDFIFRLVFMFLFSMGILEINANVMYVQLRANRYVKIALVLCLDLLLLSITLFLWKLLHPIIVNDPLSGEDRGFLAFGYITLLIALFFIARILRLQTNQRVSDIENEHLKQQNLQKELTALKNQIDPHFLFNSLNSLISLIRDNEPATKFVTKLSYMYRYILQSGHTDLVSVREELSFLDSYVYLMKTRYRDKLSVIFNIDEALMGRKIPPLALQLLVENAIKHNEVSTSKPLKINVYSKDNVIVIENTMQPRSTLADGTGTGLLNLRKRYLLLQNQEVLVTKENDIFKVELPLRKLV